MNRFRQMLAAAALLAAIAPAAAFAGEESKSKSKCAVAARECERQIREMLSGRRYLGLKMKETKWGLVVVHVAEESPAAVAGFQNDDRVVAVNGRDCSRADIRRFKEILSEARERDGNMHFVVSRYGSLKRLKAKLGTMSEEQIDKVVSGHLKEAHDQNGSKSGN